MDYTTPQRFLMAEDELLNKLILEHTLEQKYGKSLKKKFPTRKDYEKYVNGQFRKSLMLLIRINDW